MKRNKNLMIALLSVCLLAQTVVFGASLRPVRNKSVNVNVASSEALAKMDTWEFYSAQEEPTAAELAASASRHQLGKTVAFLYDAFKELYVVKEEVVPGDPTRRTVIRKPEIYNAVRAVEKELSRSVKKGELEKDKAEAELTHVLKVALAAIDSDTDSFEAALQDHKKDAALLLSVFQHVNLKNIY